ncbi:MAG: leucine-rich repeat domain-containing protein [Spirobacillus cienkowskii]|uniref:Leucine-rich repeat domain-containing protein n=1 Tax=Spirobacillus cienkowskii TaxID=495820 RepID=A0A369L0W0_9BACT|nr:MAG: leucine-rich repeat domain-containing protein [Spirobacillus cienkowskii]
MPHINFKNFLLFLSFILLCNSCNNNSNSSNNIEQILAKSNVVLNSNYLECNKFNVKESDFKTNEEYNSFIEIISLLENRNKFLENKKFTLNEIENEIKFFYNLSNEYGDKIEIIDNPEVDNMISCNLQNYFHKLNDHLSIFQNRIIYLIPQKDGTSVGKISRNNDGEKTLGGATGNLAELSDFYIDHKNLKLKDDYLAYNFLNKKSNDEVCKTLELITDGNKVKGSKFPNTVTTATPCEIEVRNSLDGALESTFTVLLNHTYRYWCQTDTKLPAYKTAQAAGLCDKTDQEIKYTFKISMDITDSPSADENKIEDISPLSGFYSLTKLSLDNNKISVLQPHLLDDLLLLSDFIISRNKLTSLPVGIFDNFAILETLYLSGNDFNSISNNLLHKIKYLDYFGIDTTFLNKISDSFFKSNNNLNTVIITEYSNLSKIPAKLFDGVTIGKCIKFYCIGTCDIPNELDTKLTTELQLERVSTDYLVKYINKNNLESCD